MADEHLKVTVNMVLDAFGDPKFYRKCPLFFGMRKAGLTAAAIHQKTGCKSCSARHVQAAVSSFCQTLFEASQEAPILLRPLAEYMTTRHNWHGKSCCLYYKHGGRDVSTVFSTESGYES